MKAGSLSQAANRSIPVAVNVGADESDLAKASPEEVQQALAPEAPELVRELQQITQLGVNRPTGRELPVPLLVSALVLLFIESFLSNRLYRSAESNSPQSTRSARRTEIG